MKVSLRAALVVTCLALLALPAGASAQTAPQPTAGDCFSRNAIEFNGLAIYQVRHTMFMRCGVPVTVNCTATLFKQAGVFHSRKTLSTLTVNGGRSCSAASRFAPQNAGLIEGIFASDAINQGYIQKWRYEITLTRRGQQWSRASGYCPTLKNNRRTLICKDVQTTRAGNKSVVKHP